MNDSVLVEAERIINGQRRVDYGNVTLSFERIARLWGGYLNREVSAHDVAHMMILMKVARAQNGYHRDSYVDVAGYAGCAELLNKEREVD